MLHKFQSLIVITSQCNCEDQHVIRIPPNGQGQLSWDWHYADMFPVVYRDIKRQKPNIVSWWDWRAMKTLQVFWECIKYPKEVLDDCFTLQDVIYYRGSDFHEKCKAYNSTQTATTNMYGYLILNVHDLCVSNKGENTHKISSLALWYNFRRGWNFQEQA